MRCGVQVRSGRPILTARVVDPDELHARAEKVIRPLSWFLPTGIYPIYSEATGRTKPYVTKAIAVFTVLISVWFWAYEWSGSPKMRSMKNLMLWAGDAKPDAKRIEMFYAVTDYGDTEAFLAKREELRHRVPPGELDRRAHEALSPEQQCFGRYRPSQLITHAFLHGDLMHLAGNLAFFLILGSRVNTVIGNLGMLVLYPLLAISAGIFHVSAEAAGQPMPSLGASGAIMGMAGMYFVLFPIHKVHVAAWLRWGLLTGFRLSFKVFSLPGFLVVLFFIAFDVLYTALGTETGTAHWAHLGGFISGAAAAGALLIGRLVYSGGDVLSLVLGKYAWPLIGTPASHAGRGGGLLGFWRRKVASGAPQTPQ